MILPTTRIITTAEIKAIIFPAIKKDARNRIFVPGVRNRFRRAG
jgi:hypothetical protein